MTRSRNRAVKGRRKESRGEGHVGPEKVWWWCFFADRWVFHLRIPQLRPVYCTGLLVCLPDLSFLPSNACHSPDRTFSGSPALTGQRPDIQGTTFKPLHCLFPPLSLSPVAFPMSHAHCAPTIHDSSLPQRSPTFSHLCAFARVFLSRAWNTCALL